MSARIIVADAQFCHLHQWVVVGLRNRMRLSIYVHEKWMRKIIDESS